MSIYRAALIGCSRMGAFIDNEIPPERAHILPLSHAAGYEAVPRTRLVALADLRPDVLERAGQRYGVAKEHQYTDYREMIVRERPDIVSIATQPEGRADIIRFVVEHGVKAIFCEKPLAASLAETMEIARLVKEHGVVFNLSTGRRWAPGNEIIRSFVDDQTLGPLQALISYSVGTLFNMGSHYIDLLSYLNQDVPAAWVQAHLAGGDSPFEGDIVRQDPNVFGVIMYENGVTAHLLATSRTAEFEAIFARGAAASLNNGLDWELRVADEKAKWTWKRRPFPPVAPRSGTKTIIEEIVHALDTGAPTRGNVDVALQTGQITFGMLESIRRGGARVELPLASSPLRLERRMEPRQPKYERDPGP
ncbi:MAG TPA: Gfo/Idh/MocA family oxidoreductase [Limnochordales bacterium]|nr:Gfo/Idh/MocA family oxidoreductase [Limnochordales bacterium]